MKMNLAALVLLATAAGAVLAGCHATDAVDTNKIPIQAPAGKTYAMGASGVETQNFTSNKLFLWNDPISPPVATIVIKAADEIDKCDDDSIVKTTLVDTQLNPAITTAGAALKDAETAAKLDDATQGALDAYYALVDQKTGDVYTTAELDQYVANGERDFNKNHAKVMAAARGLSKVEQDAQEGLAKANWMLAHMEESDPHRRELKGLIGKLKSQVLGLNPPKAVVDAMNDRDSLVDSIAGYRRQRVDAVALPQQIQDAADAIAKANPSLPTDVQAKRAALDLLYSQRYDAFRAKAQDSLRGDGLVQLVISNTRYDDFRNMDVKFVIYYSNNTVTRIEISSLFEKDDAFTTDDGTIDNVEYEPYRGIVRFNVHTEGRNGNFYRFKLGRVHEGFVKDDRRTFLQGEMNYCKAGTQCKAEWNEVIHHGMAKLVTSAN